MGNDMVIQMTVLTRFVAVVRSLREVSLNQRLRPPYGTSLRIIFDTSGDAAAQPGVQRLTTGLPGPTSQEFQQKPCLNY